MVSNASTAETIHVGLALLVPELAHPVAVQVVAGVAVGAYTACLVLCTVFVTYEADITVQVEAFLAAAAGVLVVADAVFIIGQTDAAEGGDEVIFAAELTSEPIETITVFDGAGGIRQQHVGVVTVHAAIEGDLVAAHNGAVAILHHEGLVALLTQALVVHTPRESLPAQPILQVEVSGTLHTLALRIEGA